MYWFALFSSEKGEKTTCILKSDTRVEQQRAARKAERRGAASYSATNSSSLQLLIIKVRNRVGEGEIKVMFYCLSLDTFPKLTNELMKLFVLIRKSSYERGTTLGYNAESH